MNTPDKWIHGEAGGNIGRLYGWATDKEWKKATKPKKLPPLKKGIANEIRVSVKDVYVEGMPRDLDLIKLIKGIAKNANIRVELKVELRGAGMNVKMGKWNGYDLSLWVQDFDAS